jgi:polyferredoxin
MLVWSNKPRNDKKIMRIILLSGILLMILLPAGIKAQQRFPKPEFENGYVLPATETPNPRSGTMEYLDVAVLLMVMGMTSWYVLRRRSRQGVLWMSLFSLLYFGFYRQGCICPVGSIQNIVLSFADPGYAVPVTVLIFFLLPLTFSLFFGRVFCASACPLGAIQDLLVVKPLTLPVWLQKTLGMFPYLYFILAVLFAATGTDFIICRYDPFVGIFRLNGPFLMISLGVVFLLMSIFIGRPYCRFLCPYGVLLKWTSMVSRWHLTITPSKCIQCRLCTTSCPFDAISHPTLPKVTRKSRGEIRKFILYLLLIPLWIAAGGYTGWKAHVPLSKVHPDVYLAELLIDRPELIHDKENIDVQTFLSSGKTMEMLVDDARDIRNKFKTGSTLAGAFFGLIIGLLLLNRTIFRRNSDYRPDQGNCYSCGRCMDYCPVEK